MNRSTILLSLVLSLSCGITFAQDKSKVDWEAEYKQLIESDPGVLEKIEAGQTTKEEVIEWMQKTGGGKSTSKKKELSAFQKKLDELVVSGKLSKEDAAKLAATMSPKETAQKSKKQDEVDWDAEYEKLLNSDPAVRKKVENSGATKEQVITFLKMKSGKGGKGKSKGRMKAKPGARQGSTNFYAIVIGKLKSKDIELGELELDVDYVIGPSWGKEELVGQRVKLVGVAGAFLDNLLRIKRGETIKVRTGGYNRETKVLGFGYKFQVLERTGPFKPEDFGVPPNDFRGFRGELVGKVAEAQGYEVLLDVQESKPSVGSKAKDAKSIVGKRARIAGFYDQHADAFADLHEGDKIRVSVAHRNSESDALNVTNVLKRIDDSVKAAATSAKPMHTPRKMPTAKAESVGMSTEGLSRIDELMQEHIDAGDIQGGATIVARRGKVVHFSTHGEMDVEKGRPMEPDAIYIMASSAKPVIGVAAMMLVDEGLMSLSDPVSKYIPEFADVKVAVPTKPADRDGTKSKAKKKEWDKDKGKKLGKGKKWNKKGKGKEDVPHRLVPVETPLTIHHLLTHTSGLTGGGIKRTNENTFATYIPKLAKGPLNFQPGTRWAYGNVGIHSVVPRIIEIVSKTPFHQFMRERVFNPLEMNNTYFHVPSEKTSKRVVLKGLDFSKKGGGGLCSTAEDFLHFEQMLLNGGELFGHRLLSPASVKLMSSNQVGGLYSESGKGPKGMGFGYTVAVTLDPVAAANNRGKGAFGWGGAAGTVSWTDPENELVGVLMLQQPRVGKKFGKAVREAIIE